MLRKFLLTGLAALSFVGIQAVLTCSAYPMSTVEIVAKVKPCVVLIGVWDSRNTQHGALGTGFFIDNDKIMTDAHVVNGNWNRILIGDLSGQAIPVESQPLYMNTNKDVDLAVLKVKNSGTHAHLDFATNSLQEGQTVTVIGNPGGLTGTVSTGILSAVRDNGDLLQFTAPISSGSSGGPVVNDEGEVIGIVEGARVSVQQQEIVENLNFAHGVRLMKIAAAGDQSSAWAVNKQPAEDDDLAAAAVRRKMLAVLNEQLALTADQQDQAKPIIEKHVAGLEALKNDATLGSADKKAKVAQLRRQYVLDINDILAPDQQKKWAAWLRYFR
jgi:S1-C subfamily serine protease